MPNLTSIRANIARLPSGPPLVVVLVGGTTGIGSYVARAFATTFAKQGAKLRVYLVGRRQERADEVIAFGQETAPGSEWVFVKAGDLALMSEVENVCGEIKKLEEGSGGFGGGNAKPRVDILYLSAALSPLQDSPLTSESLDSQSSLLYYSRIYIITLLTPLLLSSPTYAHVISIFAGNTQDRDPCIGTPPKESYGVTSIRANVCFMKTFAFEELAQRYEGKVAFTHVYPGLVDGPTFYSGVNPWWFRVLWGVLKPFATWYMTAPETCGQIMLSLATDRYPAKGVVAEGDGDVAFGSARERGGGCYSVGRFGDESGGVSWEGLRREGLGEEVWAHTMGVIEGAVAKGRAV